MWCMEAKTPVECYARSIDKVLGPVYKGIDATAGMIMFSDGSVYHLNISWALPVTNGLEFVNSWVAADLGRCFQLMECGDNTRLQRWVAEWSDLTYFEIVPVVPGKETAAALADRL